MHEYNVLSLWQWREYILITRQPFLLCPCTRRVSSGERVECRQCLIPLNVLKPVMQQTLNCPSIYVNRNFKKDLHCQVSWIHAELQAGMVSTGVHKWVEATRPRSGVHAAHRKLRCGPLDPTENVSILAHNSICYVGPYKHGYEGRKFAIVSVKRHHLQRDFIPLPWLNGPHWGHNPQTSTMALHFASRNISGTMC